MQATDLLPPRHHTILTIVQYIKNTRCIISQNEIYNHRGKIKTSNNAESASFVAGPRMQLQAIES
jgi:hypothetical protein